MKRVPETGAMNDPDEVNSYDRLSKQYLKLVERSFINRACSLLKKTNCSENPLVLDVGTGPCRIPIHFAGIMPSARFVAMDLSQTMLRKARSNIYKAGVENRIELLCAQADNLPFRDGYFDLVISHSIIHHLVNPLPAIGEIVRVTKRKCPFIIRDLRRPPFPFLELYVQIFGFPYDSLMKKMYRESLHAGYTFREMKGLAHRLRDVSVKARRFFITHVGIEGIRD